jgi:predicted RNA-binding protein YlqC (UPF0109 family)
MTEDNNYLIAEAVRSVTSLVDGIARSLVDEPTAVEVRAITNESLTATFLDLKVAPADLGKVIGKQGRTARAIRIVLSAASMKLKHRFELQICEEGRR